MFSYSWHIKLALILLSLTTFTNCGKSTFKAFHKYLNHHGKHYSGKEFFSRYQIFAKNLEQVKSGFSVKELSPYMELTSQEFQNRFLSDSSDNNPERTSSMKFLTSIDKTELKDDTLDNFDWRTKGIVTKVKDQLECKSYWAFAGVAAIESQYAIKYNKLEEFSEQQVLDCQTVSTNNCNGGWVYHTLRYSKTGLESNRIYPYTGKEGMKCDYDSRKVDVFVDKLVYIDDNEETIKQALYKNGPLSASINGKFLQYYVKGTILDSTPSLCNPYELNHAVLLVGYGVSNFGIKYWIAKNSWGASWGDNGYFLIKRGSGVCGINSSVIGVEVSNK